MKKILVLLITVGISCVGCAEWTPEQHAAWGNFWQNYSQQQQNLTYQQNMQLRENAREINRQLQSRRPKHIIIDDY